MLDIGFNQDRLIDFCRKHHIRKLSLFGSVLRDDFTPESDVDVLVEFEAGYTPGLAFFAMQDELSAILGRKVDLNTPECLSPYFRDRVLAEAEVLYDAAYEATEEAKTLSANPQFLNILERARARLKAEGGISPEEMRRRLGLPQS